MAIPTLNSVAPTTGPTSGGDLVRLTGTGFSATIQVTFGRTPAEVVSAHEEQGVTVVDVRSPAHADGVVDITVYCLDTKGQRIAGKAAVLPATYRFLRPRIAQEADLTRLVRTLLRELKRQIIANASMTVAVDYADGGTVDGHQVTAISQLPSLVLSGPRVSENRFFSTNEPGEEMVAGGAGPEVIRRRPPYTVDLSFTLSAASDRTAELLNLMAAVAAFLARNRWVEMLRDPEMPATGTVRWEMDPEGEFRTRLDGEDDVRVFTCGFVVRGFDIDEGLPLDVGRAVDERPQLRTGALQSGGRP